MRRTWRWVLGVLIAIVLVTALVLWLLLRGSLADLDGEHALPGLAKPVTLERDALGVVTITAGSQADAMRALGRVHAQERYFEMDLMRRSAAGELSALFGPKAIDADKRMRVHRLRARTEAHMVDAALGDNGDAVRAYVDGVNEGLADLSVRPWAYLLLRQSPQPWQASDSVLAGLAMYADLQDPGNQTELALSRIRAVVPSALYALIAHDGTEWDAPLFGEPTGNATLPDASQLDLRTLKGKPGTGQEEADAVGSNNFAVAGALTADGRAIVADDMHLGLRAPSLWFRVRLRYPDPQAAGGQVDVTGFSLPGLPAVIVGSNGHVAWGFTNSYIDTADYRTEPANAAVTVHEERIAVAGQADVRFPVRETAWGPILHTHADGSGDALRWVAQLPGAVRLDFGDLARAGDLDAALQFADHAGIPAQNLVVGDRTGRIAWRLIGARPDRGPGCAPAGFNAAHNQDCAPWPIRSDASPALIDPPNHRLWTANGRVLDGEALATVGNGGYDLGARARQIRDLLAIQERFDEHDLLAIQLDDRAVFLQRWWALLHDVIERSDDPALKRLKEASHQWGGRASASSVSYRVVREFRTQVMKTLSDALLAPANAQLGDDYLEPRLAQLEGVAWPMLQQRPANLLPPAFDSWDALLIDAARRTESELTRQGPLAKRSWGERNTAAICHPIARALPDIAKRWLCMPADRLPGDRDMPRVQTPNFGASERMVVSPGHEADGIVHMPGGQSGHPLSPYWGAGHEDWVHGRPTPFLPGKAQHTMTLVPAR